METFTGTATAFALENTTSISIDDAVLKYNSLKYEGTTRIFTAIIEEMYVGVHCDMSKEKPIIKIIIRGTNGRINADNVLDVVKNDPSMRLSF